MNRLLGVVVSIAGCCSVAGCGPALPADGLAEPPATANGTSSAATARPSTPEVAKVSFCGKEWPADTTRVDCHDKSVTSLEPLASLPKLAILDIGKIGHDAAKWEELEAVSATDLAPLAGCHELRVLSLYGVAVTTLAPLAKSTNLEELDLQFTSVSDLSPLAGLAKLQTLSLEAVPATDFAPIAKLTSLRKLGLESTSLGDVKPLAALVNLEHIAISSTSVTDIRPIAALPKLTRFIANGMSSIDFTVLGPNKSIKVVAALGVGPATIEKLAKNRPDIEWIR